MRSATCAARCARATATRWRCRWLRRSADCSGGGRRVWPATCGSARVSPTTSSPRSRRARCGRATDCDKEQNMPLPAIPPLFAWALGALGAAALAKVVVKEWRRLNVELDEVKHTPASEPAAEALPKLKRDPETGVYRPN